MDYENCNQLFQDALAKAFSAKADEVRMAWFDLASFYHGQLDGNPNHYPLRGAHCGSLSANGAG